MGQKRYLKNELRITIEFCLSFLLDVDARGLEVLLQALLHVRLQLANNGREVAGPAGRQG